MTRLRIGLQVRAPLGDALREALTRLGERADVLAIGDGGPWDTVVREPGSTPAPGERTTMWIESADALDGAAPAVAVALLASPAVGRAVRHRARVPVLALGPAAVHPHARPIAPFTRARLRRARGLEADTAVARQDDAGWSWDGRPLEDAAAATAVALAAVVVVQDEDAAVLAAAWGAPVVAPLALADALDLPLPAERLEDPQDEAARLLADPAAAARHARGCHEVHLRDRSPDRTLLELAEVLRSAGGGRPARDLEAPLDQLGAPRDAVVRMRARQAVATLTGAR